MVAASFPFEPQTESLPTDTLESGDRTFTYRAIPLTGSAKVELLILNDLSPSVALLRETRLQLLLIGGLAFLLVLASSWPLIERVTASDGYLVTAEQALQQRTAEFNEDLEELEERMKVVEERYNRQFLVMQNIIEEMNSTKESLISSFENLPFSNKD